MEKNKELIATIEHQNNVIKSLSKLFLTVYEIDLLNIISLSIGYSSSTEDLVYSLSELAKIADKRMYENKNQFYKNN